jgi:hypothetical protein
VIAGSITTNQGEDRGRQGEGGAKVWARVLYEIAAPQSPTQRYVLVTAHGYNDGKRDGAGTEVTRENFFDFARVTVGGIGQWVIATHINPKKKGSIKQAEIVEWDVDAPAKGRSVSEFVSQSRAKELVPKWFP